MNQGRLLQPEQLEEGWSCLQTIRHMVRDSEGETSNECVFKSRVSVM